MSKPYNITFQELYYTYNITFGNLYYRYNITRPGAEGAEEKNAFRDGEMPKRTRRNEVLQVASNPVIWHGL